MTEDRDDTMGPLHHEYCNVRLLGRDCDCGLDALRNRVAELEAQKQVVLEYRDALNRLLDHATEVRGYCEAWEWKYGKAWDEEENAAREVLQPKQ